jgi:heterotetrameric sarcosine oxidase delta subunit
MLLLTCPHCGPRNVNEFRHGGETNPRPSDPSAVDDAAWADFLYMRQNTLGVQTEWWYHRQGCGQWFLAERHTGTNAVVRTWVWRRADRSLPPPAPPPQEEGSVKADGASQAGLTEP